MSDKVQPEVALQALGEGTMHALNALGLWGERHLNPYVAEAVNSSAKAFNEVYNLSPGQVLDKTFAPKCKESTHAGPHKLSQEQGIEGRFDRLEYNAAMAVFYTSPNQAVEGFEKSLKKFATTVEHGLEHMLTEPHSKVDNDTSANHLPKVQLTGDQDK